MRSYVKWIGMSLFLLWNCFTAIEAKEDSINYRVTRSDYTFSTVFDMNNEKFPIGSVLKSVFHVATHYDSYDGFGLYEGQGICRLSSLGLFYTWATEIDVYNAEGEKVGMIDGQVMSSEPAKFSFYDEAENKVAVAYLDQNCMGFSLVHPDNSAFILAHLSRNFVLDAIDTWDVVIYSPDLVPPHLVKIFAAFVCDTQNKFKPDL